MQRCCSCCLFCCHAALHQQSVKRGVGISWEGLLVSGCHRQGCSVELVCAESPVAAHRAGQAAGRGHVGDPGPLCGLLHLLPAPAPLAACGPEVCWCMYMTPHRSWRAHHEGQAPPAVCVAVIIRCRLTACCARYMLELGRFVPVVPVVTKADTMTIAEAARYRRGGHTAPLAAWSRRWHQLRTSCTPAHLASGQHSTNSRPCQRTTEVTTGDVQRSEKSCRTRSYQMREVCHSCLCILCLMHEWSQSTWQMQLWDYAVLARWPAARCQACHSSASDKSMHAGAALASTRCEPVNVLRFEDDTLARAGLQHKDKACP